MEYRFRLESGKQTGGGKLTIRDLRKPAREFIRDINRALNGREVFDKKLSEYLLCKHMGISKQELDDMNYEDVLAWQWIMKRELKHQERKAGGS